MFLFLKIFTQLRWQKEHSIIFFKALTKAILEISGI